MAKEQLNSGPGQVITDVRTLIAEELRIKTNLGYWGTTLEQHNLFGSELVVTDQGVAELPFMLAAPITTDGARPMHQQYIALEPDGTLSTCKRSDQAPLHLIYDVKPVSLIDYHIFEELAMSAMKHRVEVSRQAVRASRLVRQLT